MIGDDRAFCFEKTEIAGAFKEVSDKRLHFPTYPSVTMSRMNGLSQLFPSLPLVPGGLF
ncbi:MAG: hypothetical protein INH13_27355, partial [Cupriavidus sp.]|nr:hypothetical protein [Cupriavidus sp.]